MSRTSRISSEWRLGRERRAFRIRLGVVLGALALLCGGLAVLATGQGPRIQSLRSDPAALVAGPGGIVELRFSRPIAELDPEAVTVEPSVPAAVEATGSSAVVRFARALDADTSYRIAIDGVAGAGGGPAARVEATIETPPWELELLVPGADGAADAVVSTGLDGGEPTVLHRGEGIREFARLDDTVLVVTDLDRARSELSLHAVDGVGRQDFVLPEEGRVAALGIVDTVVLFTLTSAAAEPVPEFDLTLFRIDLAADVTPTPVLGLGGEPISVLDWFPIPGTLEVLLAGRDGSLQRYSPLDGSPPIPVSQFPEVFGASPDGTGVVAADPFGPVLLDLASGATSRLTPTPIDGVEPYVGEVVLLDDTRRVAKVALPDADGGFATSLVLDDGRAAVPLSLPEAEGASIAEFRASPSGQYLVIVLDSSEPGGRVSGPTLVVDVGSGAVVARLPGVAPAW